jgi:MtrB/PioB family decaheme-associated outer membrane protein
MNAPSGASLRTAVTIAAPVAAALVACPVAWAQEDAGEIARLVTPTSSVSAGLGWVSGENRRFGQYTGMTDEGEYLLFDVDVRRRSAGGIWLNARGRNLGLDSRELRLEFLRQGSWGTFVDFSQTPRNSPYTPLTRLLGADSAQQTVNGVAVAAPLELSTERKALTAGLDMVLGRGFDLQFRVRNEEKEGRRLFGRSGTDFLVDPIDYNTQIFEATAGYTAERLQLSGGYVGTNFVNGKTRLDVTGGTGGAFTPIALPPGNESHQFHVGGGFGITRTTRMTFRLARSLQTQNEAFPDLAAAATGRRDLGLGGRIDGTFGQLGISSRPLPALSLLANLRYDHRDDKTPVVDYFPTLASSTSTGENEPRSFRTRNAKAEATYRLPAGYSLMGGVENEVRWRNTSSVRIVSFRDETDETTYRVDLRRSMSETLNGSIGFARSQRSGSEWYTNVLSNATGTGPGTTLGSNLLHPLHLADRDRDKVRGSLAWQATDALELNFLTEYSRDDYSGRTLGMRKGHARLHSVDAGLRISDTWTASAWASYDDTFARLESCSNAAGTNTGNLSACPNTTAAPIWEAHLRNIGKALGFGLRGKVSGPLEVGADLTYSEDAGEFRQDPRPATVGAVPDANYTRATFKVYGQYALTKRSGIRAQYIRDEFKTDDWTWTNWTYSDGTRILRNPKEAVDFVGLTGYFNF